MKTKYIFAGFVVILATLTIWQIAKTNKNTPPHLAKTCVNKKNINQSSSKNIAETPLTDSLYDQISGRVKHVREHEWITVRGLSVKVNRSYYTKKQRGWEDLVEGQPDLDKNKRIIGDETYLVIDATFYQKPGTTSLGFTSFLFNTYSNQYKNFSGGKILTSTTYFSKNLTEAQRQSSSLLVNPLETGKKIRTKFIYVLDDSYITDKDYPFFHISLSCGALKSDRPGYHGLIYLEPENRT